MLATFRRIARRSGRPAAHQPAVVPALLERGHVLDAYALAGGTRSLAALETGVLRQLRNELRLRGYLSWALQVARLVERAGGDRRDRRAGRRIAGEIAVLTGHCTPTVRAGAGPYRPTAGRILHLVGHSLLDEQVGYTLRTHYTAMAQRAAGLDPQVATQAGVPGRTRAAKELDGITYHRLGGPGRADEPFDSWLCAHVQRVAGLVRVVRPAVLHAASDLINARAATVVGRAFQVPVVYESRGFWEETWLARAAARYGWDLARLATTYGLPEAYVWRREIEDRLRREADRVVTLAPIMADRVEAGGVPRDRITVVPNAVAPDEFPVGHRDPALAAQHGIGPEVTVIGYVSSLNEYEGIDILISAFAAVRRAAVGPAVLVVVGDGPARDQLMRHARSLGLDDVVFTGQIPHSAVPAYYHLIDIFVVPRQPLALCHLVTPLKPYEAFSTGRAVVLSSVRALAAIAEQSGAAELFDAGDPGSLAAVLIGLLRDPARRTELGRAGAAWVRAERTWAGNAEIYSRLYRELGALRPPPGPAGVPVAARHSGPVPS
jgi:glycosyltransferase involved in cell wall biosynthesis